MNHNPFRVPLLRHMGYAYVGGRPVTSTVGRVVVAVTKADMVRETRRSEDTAERPTGVHRSQYGL